WRVARSLSALSRRFKSLSVRRRSISASVTPSPSMAGILNDASSSAIELLPAGPQRPMLEITGLHKRFGAVEVLRDVSLAVTPGEVVVVIGPSGSGKTTLLRCINLLEEYESGTVTIEGEPIGYRIEAGSRRPLRMSERASA